MFIPIDASALADITGGSPRIAQGAGQNQINQSLILQVQTLGQSISAAVSKQQNNPDLMSQMLPMMMMMKQS